MKRLIILTSIVAISSFTYYLLIHPRYFEETSLNGQIIESVPAGFTAPGALNDDLDFNSNEAFNKNTLIQSDVATGRGLEIFGRVVDKHNQPIDNTLVVEERFFSRTRTGRNGKYKIFVDMPDNLYPVMRFLRRGFESKRIKIDAGISKQKSLIELDVALDDDPDSISIDGWIGNDIGVGLGGLKIQITSRDSRGMDTVFHTVFSDDKGYFTFEGIRSGDLYRLTASPPAEYLYYVDEEFRVTHNTPQLNIILETLKFIDIDGMVVNSNVVPIPNFEIYISNLSTGTHARRIVTDSSGFFSLQNFPVGEVFLTTQGPEYFKIKGLTLTPNEYRNLKLVVDKGDYYLSGWVSDESGVPIANAIVALNSKIEDGPIEYSSYRIKGTDSSGKFHFDNLGSGEHLIIVEGFGFKSQEIIHRFDTQTDVIHITLVGTQ